MKIKNKLKLKVALSYLKYFALVLSVIGLFAWFTGKYAEAILFCIAHYVIRPKFDKQFHFYNQYACLALTIGVGIMGIYVTLPLSVSLLSSIVVVFIICWIGYVIADWLDLKAKQKFSVKQCSRDALIARCAEKGFSEKETKLCILLFKSGLKGDELYKAVYYSERQTKYLRKKYLAILET